MSTDEGSVDDMASFREYIGVGEAHHPGPVAKKPRIDDDDVTKEVDEGAEPPSTDVFASSQGSSESGGGDTVGITVAHHESTDYETAPESMEEMTPTKKKEETTHDENAPKSGPASPEVPRTEIEWSHRTPNSTRISANQKVFDSAQKTPKNVDSTPKSTDSTPKPAKTPVSGRKLDLIRELASKTPKTAQSPGFCPESAEKSAQKPTSAQSPEFCPTSPENPVQNPKSAEKSAQKPDLSLKSISSAQNTPKSAQKPESAQKTDLGLKSSEKSPQKPDPSPKTVQSKAQKALFREKDTPIQKPESDGSVDDVVMDSPRKEEEEEKDPGLEEEEKRMDCGGDGSDGSDDEDAEVIRDMQEGKEKKKEEIDSNPTSQDIFTDEGDHPEYPEMESNRMEVDQFLEKEDDEEEGLNQMYGVLKSKQEMDEKAIEKGIKKFQINPVDREQKTPESSRKRGPTEEATSPKSSDSKERKLEKSEKSTEEESKEISEEEKERRREYEEKEMPALLEKFKREKIVFRPNLGNKQLDPKKHYRYCEIEGLDDPVRPHRSSPVLNQQWQELNYKDDPNQLYDMQKHWLREYLRAHKSGFSGYQLFCGLIQDMIGDQLKLIEFNALYSYYVEMKESIGETKVLEQFANVVRWALRAESFLPKRIYVLLEGVESATFSHEQCACLVARMFFNRTSRYNDKMKAKQFIDILRSPGDIRLGVEKLKFIFTYFDKMTAEKPKGCVSFRKVYRDRNFEEKWKTERKTFDVPEVRMIDDMYIEETAFGTQVDFANEMLGGGVLGRGAVQEEIRFLMCPEMMVSMMLMPRKMAENESFSIVGAMCFSSYSGYSASLKWRPLGPTNARQNHSRDAFGRLQTETIAIDAIPYQTSYYYSETRNIEQQMGDAFEREFLKAVAGFDAQGARFHGIPIVSGWWGCGAFGGFKPLKFIIQVIAAGYADRKLYICTFGDFALSEMCRKFMEFCHDKRVQIFELFGSINNMARTMSRLPTQAEPFFHQIKEIIMRRREERRLRTSSSTSTPRLNR